MRNNLTVISIEEKKTYCVNISEIDDDQFLSLTTYQDKISNSSPLYQLFPFQNLGAGKNVGLQTEGGSFTGTWQVENSQ